MRTVWKGAAVSLAAAMAASVLMTGGATATPTAPVAANAAPVPAPAPSCAGSYTGLQLTAYPSADEGYPLAEHGVVTDQAVLDAFAREYANCPHRESNGKMVTTAPDVQDFFLFWLPNRLNDIADGVVEPPVGTKAVLDLSTPAGLGRALWLNHLSGYYSGVWLRINMHVPIGLPITESNMANVYATAVDTPRHVALAGSSEEVLAFNRSSLRSKPPLGSSIDLTTVIGIVMPAGNDAGQFGFDLGFMRFILPPSLNAPPNAKPFATPYYKANPNKLLDATYALPEVPALVEARKAFAAAQSNSASADRLKQTISGRLGELHMVTQQQQYYLHATALYAVGIPLATSYRGFGPEQYDRVLAWAAYCVMANQSNSFNALSAVATQDAVRGRRHARANALWGTYMFTYLRGLFDFRHEGESMEVAMPSFVK
jgi:hypothetical protein